MSHRAAGVEAKSRDAPPLPPASRKVASVRFARRSAARAADDGAVAADAIMLVVVVRATIARQSHLFQPFALALLLVLLVDPFAPLSAGFWAFVCGDGGHHSVGAWAGFTRHPLWRVSASLQLVVSIALLPFFTLALFGSIPPSSACRSSLLAIPAVRLVLRVDGGAALVALLISSLASNAVLSLSGTAAQLGWSAGSPRRAMCPAALDPCEPPCGGGMHWPSPRSPWLRCLGRC